MQRLMYTAVFCLLGAVALAQQQPLFTALVAKESGVHFVNEIKETEGLNVLAYEYFFNGAGVAVGDLNNDGLADLFFTANMKANKLFLNVGNLHFKDITKAAGKGLEGREGDWSTGVTMADVNADGWLDIYVCYSGKLPAERRRNQLFINNHNLSFTESAAQYGIDDSSHTNQAAFFDYDKDGDLDLFLLNHSTRKVDNLAFAKVRKEIDAAAGCKLFRNDKGRFTEVTATSGIQQSALTFGLGLVVADVNLDNWPDIYVTNDYNEPDHLYINNKDGTFSDKIDSAFDHISQFSMGADMADFNNDGLPDLVTLDMMPEDNRRQKLLQLQENYEVFELMQQQGLHKQYMRNMLQLNNGNGSFSEIGQLAGIAETDWSWSPIFADLDNDGWKDIFITNGYLRDYTNKDFLKYWGDYKVKKAMDREPVQLMELVKAMPSTKIPNYVFRNEGNLQFTNQQTAWGFSAPLMSSGAVCADLDNDGDLDIVINNVNEEASVYRNNSNASGKINYLAIDMRLPNGTVATGGKALVYANGQKQYAELVAARGYLSSAQPILHFGLGANTQVDSLLLIWPDGRHEVRKQLVINQLLRVQESDNTNALAGEKRNAESAIWTLTNSPIPYRHESFQENDFKRQPLMLFMYSNTGPVMASADVNKDGLQDVFISGNKQEPGNIWLQKADGSFSKAVGIPVIKEDEAAIADALFVDVNADGWPDLYLAKGGYSIWEPNTPSLQDELWMNNGKGGFVRAEAALPDVSASAKSCVRAADADGDGDMDLFVGGRVIPGRYPVTPQSYLLINDGTGKFAAANVPFRNAGMVTDAAWHDWDGDGRQDLLLCGEMMPIMLYRNTNKGFEPDTQGLLDGAGEGFWSSLAVTDINGDGMADLIAGNLGMNVPFRVSEKEPAELIYADFDKNGSVDPFFTFYIKGKSYPYVSRDELNDQMYSMRKKFTSYAQYADATINEILSPAELSSAARLFATEQKTSAWIQQNGKMKAVELPVQAQFSYTKKIMTGDYNNDGYKDILLLGNQTANRLKMGAIAANQGCLLAGDGKGGFRYLPQTVSGLRTYGEVKSGIMLTVGTKQYLLVGAGDQPLQAYEW